MVAPPLGAICGAQPAHSLLDARCGAPEWLPAPLVRTPHAARTVRWAAIPEGQRCADAQNAWDDAIDGAWSVASLGLLSLATSAFIFERPLADGRWPSSLSDEERRALDAVAKEEE